MVSRVRRRPLTDTSRSIELGGDTHCQAVLEGCGLSFADARRSREAPAKGADGRKTGTASQTLREIQG